MAETEAAPVPPLKALVPPAPPAEDGLLGQALAKLKTVDSEESAQQAATELAQLLKAEGIEQLHKVCFLHTRSNSLPTPSLNLQSHSLLIRQCL